MAGDERRVIRDVGDCWDVLAGAGLPKLPFAGPGGDMLFPAAERVAAMLDERDAMHAEIATLRAREERMRAVVEAVRGIDGRHFCDRGASAPGVCAFQGDADGDGACEWCVLREALAALDREDPPACAPDGEPMPTRARRMIDAQRALAALSPDEERELFERGGWRDGVEDPPAPAKHRWHLFADGSAVALCGECYSGPTDRCGACAEIQAQRDEQERAARSGAEVAAWTFLAAWERAEVPSEVTAAASALAGVLLRFRDARGEDPPASTDPDPREMRALWDAVERLGGTRLEIEIGNRSFGEWAGIVGTDRAHAGPLRDVLLALAADVGGDDHG